MSKAPLVLMIEDDTYHMKHVNEYRDALACVLRIGYHCEVKVVKQIKGITDEGLLKFQQERQAGRLILALVGECEADCIPLLQQRVGADLPIIILSSGFVDFFDDLKHLPQIISQFSSFRHTDLFLQIEVTKLVSTYLQGQVVEPPVVKMDENYVTESARLASLSVEDKGVIVDNLWDQNSQIDRHHPSVKGFAIDVVTMERQITEGVGDHRECIKVLWERFKILLFYPGSFELPEPVIFFGLICKDQQFNYPILVLYSEVGMDEQFATLVEKLRAEGEYLILPIMECIKVES